MGQRLGKKEKHGMVMRCCGYLFEKRNYLSEWCKLELVFVAQSYALYQFLLLFYFVTVQILQQSITVTQILRLYAC